MNVGNHWGFVEERREYVRKTDIYSCWPSNWLTQTPQEGCQRYECGQKNDALLVTLSLFDSEALGTVVRSLWWVAHWVQQARLYPGPRVWNLGVHLPLQSPPVNCAQSNRCKGYTVVDFLAVVLDWWKGFFFFKVVNNSTTGVYIFKHLNSVQGVQFECYLPDSWLPWTFFTHSCMGQKSQMWRRSKVSDS